ncbi:MAG: glycerophosphodiester phosphodiesterase [Promethearchaeota archaeon]|nr:MAG: glycerophosphodiester phosphodiesterase [Candidatus Lokiarchaeota archaeon]
MIRILKAFLHKRYIHLHSRCIIISGSENSRPIIIGHRGANAEAPENTLKSFQRAIELGADYVEFDVQSTKDDELVIIHDENTYRTSNHMGLIREMTLEELKELDFGEGEKIPTLEELIELAIGKVGFQCEIKVKGIGVEVAKIFQEYNILDSTLISSFIHSELKAIQKYKPEFRLASLEPTGTGWVTDWVWKQKIIEEAINNNFEAIHPLYRLVNKDFINYAHQEGLKVNVWTVDSKIAMRKLIKIGIDGIVTNDIKLAKSIFKKY